MSLEYFRSVFAEVDRELEGAAESDVPKILQKLSLDVFSLAVWRGAQMGEFENLSRFLTPLPDPQVQARFAGGKGEALLPRVVHFVNYLKLQTSLAFGRTDVSFLDYGCGWGRMSRLLPYFTPLQNIALRDPNPECRKFLVGADLQDRFEVIPRVPQADTLPDFDVCFLFSVLTHTPQNVTDAIFSAVSGRSDRLVIVTVRPETIWKHAPSFPEGFDGQTYLEQHRANGYAFYPQGPGNETYGDSSYSYQRLIETASRHGLELVDSSFNLVDSLQVFFTFRTT